MQICRRCDEIIEDEQAETGIHDWCRLLEVKDAEEARAESWARLAERLAWHLADCHTALRFVKVGYPTSYGDNGTKALADFRAMVSRHIMVPRDYVSELDQAKQAYRERATALATPAGEETS